MNDRGEEVKAGGRVVKNVAGYDLMKLYTGSFGTLGIITQLTLKVKPRPEAVAALAMPCTVERLQSVLTPLLPRHGDPADCDQPGQRTAASQLLGLKPSPCTLLVAYEEKADDGPVAGLAAQLANCRANWDNRRANSRAISRPACCSKLERLPARTPARSDLQGQPSAAASTFSFFLRADRLSAKPALVAHAGNGIVFGHLPEELSLEQDQEDSRRTRAGSERGVR